MWNKFLACSGGINLRNLLWHGFILPDEARPQWVALLLLVILSSEPLAAVFRDNPAARRPRNQIPWPPRAGAAVSASWSMHKIWTMLQHDGPNHLGL